MPRELVDLHIHLLDTNMRSEVKMLRDAGIPSEAQLDQTLRWAREATFVQDGGRAAVGLGSRRGDARSRLERSGAAAPGITRASRTPS